MLINVSQDDDGQPAHNPASINENSVHGCFLSIKYRLLRERLL